MENSQELERNRPNSSINSHSNVHSITQSTQMNNFQKFLFLNRMPITKIIICIIIILFILFNTIQTFSTSNTPTFHQSDLFLELVKILQGDKYHNLFQPNLKPIIAGNHTSF